MNVNDIDLGKFCDEWGSLADTPFRREPCDGFRYATNGVILVRVPRRSEDECTIEYYIYDSAAKLFDLYKPNGVWEMMPVIPDSVTKCFKIANRMFDGKWLRKISEIPEAEIIAESENNCVPLVFRFCGGLGAGLLMPGNPDCDEFQNAEQLTRRLI